MSRIRLSLLALALSLPPGICRAAEPKADQPPAAGAEPPSRPLLLPPAPPTPESPANPKAIMVPAAAAEPLLTAGRDDAAELKAAQEERIKVLTQLMEGTLSQYMVGAVDFMHLSSVADELCEAQLDSTNEPEKRVALLTKQLARANDVLKVAQAKYDAGTIIYMDVCRAKALCLRVKIKLLQERRHKRPPASTPPGKQP